MLDDFQVPESARLPIGGQKRFDILDVAIDVLVTRGFDNTRYADVSEASGVAVSTLQYYFGSLENLLIECCLYASERDYQRTLERMSEFPDPWLRLQDLVRIFVTPGAPHPNWQAQLEYWRATFTRPHLRESLVRDQDRWRAILAETIREGVEKGVFSSTRDPNLIAMQVNCLTDGTVFPAVSRNPAFDAKAFTDATIADLANLLGVASNNS